MTAVSAVAGLVFMPAMAEDYNFSTVPTYNGTQGGSYCGVSFTLGATDATRFTSSGGALPEEVILSSITLTERGGYDLATDRVLYITDSNNVYLGASSLLSKADGTDIAVFSFDDSICLDAGATYYAYLIASGSVTSWVAGETTVSSGQYYSGQLAAAGGSLDAAGAVNWGLLNGQKANASTGYAPVMSISVSSIPDMYWEGGTSGAWSGSMWSTADNDTGSLGAITTSGNVNVVFNNVEGATIDVGARVKVKNMSVAAGAYSFTGVTGSAGLDITEKLTIANGATANVDAPLTTGSMELGGTLGISQTVNVSDNGSVVLNAGGTINLINFECSSSDPTFTAAVNAYGSVTNSYTVITGGSVIDNGVSWQIDGVAATGGSFDESTGVFTHTAAGSVYGVGDAFDYDGGETIDGRTASKIALNGGTLNMEGVPTNDGYITATVNGGSIELNGQELAQSKLGTLNGEVKLTGYGTYDLGAETALKTNLSLGNNWTGTIRSTGSINTPTTELYLDAYTKNGSAVELGAVNVKSLTSGTTASVTVKSLGISEESSVGGDLTLSDGSLVLGSAGASLEAARLSVGGDLTLSDGTLVLGSAGASLEAASLITTGNLTVSAASQAVLEALNAKAAQDGSVTIITLTDGYTGDLATSEILVPRSRAAYVSPVEKYFVSLQWDSSKTTLEYAATANPEYVAANVDASSKNGRAGVALLTQAFLELNPQGTAPQSGLARALDEVDAGKMTDDGAAAIAGAATAVLGMAAHGDLDRQLQAIRNRTTTMGVNQSVVNDDMPYFNAWINAEGNYATLGDDGTAGGYKLTNWGGTVGFDVDFTPTFTAGMALTAMYGDLSVTGVDQAEGELNSYYVSAFARYCASAWTHTFVATAGLSDIQLDRTVMGEELEGSTDGVSFGLMYEVGRVFALDEDATSCLQPVLNITWRHTSVNGYREKGGSLALKVDDQTLDTVTVGLGARVQAIVGENMYNRTSIFEARVLAKFDIGDRRSATSVGLAGIEADIESAELGAMGLEAGAGLTIPLGDEGGSLFMDAAVELRSNYTNVNGTIGYRINF